ncbi:MAG: Nramp family divalent metal transporter [Sphingomonas sp.]|uniref:Nramp family divalent metal transporter n=1 Tax=Sphingomonas sp. TaxID=28214 RepID=UPI001AC0EEB5|nr:Nramp family divalent metal transporter [Sphingomonas sp.]MBN8806617.1 Nramp family divalent metal transporter [Sphingomonas sp.]
MTVRNRIRSVALVDQLGPGLITGAADDDPSGIATYSQAGAQFGFGLLWTMVLSYPLMCAVQLVSAHIGRVTGCGLSKNMAQVIWRPAVTGLVVLLFVANTINIGADLAAMGSAAELTFGISAHVMTVAFAVGSLMLQLFVAYRRYAAFLKWLTLALFAYVALLLVIHVEWRDVLGGLVPQLDGAKSVSFIVAIFGTTISPYLFFWQSAQEVEEVAQKPDAKPLLKAPEQARSEFRRIRIDTLVGMAVSNLVAIAIIIGTAATLHQSGRTIETAADAATALEPVAGRFAYLLFSLGIIGTGLLAVPVLAGSAAYAVGETRDWKCGLEHKPWEAVGFYSIIAAATILGVVIDWSSLDPIKALFYSAIVNGVVAVPIMAVMMVVVSRRDTMGRFTAPRRLLALGWIATGVMAAAAVAMVVLP